MNSEAGQQFIKTLLYCLYFSLKVSEVRHAHFEARIVNKPLGFGVRADLLWPSSYSCDFLAVDFRIVCSGDEVFCFHEAG